MIETIAGKKLLFAMAAEAEYGPHLKRLFKPLMTGVGPVEAALAMGVSLGSAGSRSLEQTEIYQAVSVTYRDMDASPLGFVKGTTPFLDLPPTVPLPYKIPGIREATLSTGGMIISGAAYDAIAEDMVEMETFAVLRACQMFTLPLVALRGISDGKAELRHVGDWTEYLHVIDEKLAEAVGLLERAIETGAVTI